MQTADSAHDELLTIYQLATEDVERAKHWAWQVASQSILAQLGLLGIRQAYGQDAGRGIELLFVAVTLLVAFVATIYIGDAEDSLGVFRDRVKRCVERLQPSSRELLGQSPRKYRWPLQRLVWGTAVVTLVLIFVR